jgi:rhamnose transport system ATP-binding protein
MWPVPSPRASEVVPVIRIRGVSKRFGGVQALTDIDLCVDAGSIHALVGQNGAGKSTLLGVVAGGLAPTAGEVEIFGRRLPPGSPRAARAAGVAAIHQQLAIVPTLSAQANVFLGLAVSRCGFLDDRRMRERFDARCAELGVLLLRDVDARDLSVAQQQLLEIMRALESSARVILLDEPTTSLGPVEREALFGLMRQLRDSGVTMIFVSHNLDDVLSIADHVTVFRDGVLVGTRRAADWTKPSLVRAMIGEADPAAEREVAARRPVGSGATPVKRELVRVENLCVPGVLEGIDLVIHHGEILGVFGLVGSGRSTLLTALAGLHPTASGRLWIDGVEVPWPHTVRRARRLGVALVPEDRTSQGLLPTLTARENVTVSDLGATAWGPFVVTRRMRQQAAAASTGLGFDERRLDEDVRNLSGGNQQKLLLARWRHARPRLLLADEPTLGVDIAAKARILRSLREIADEGAGVLLVSSQLEEVAETSDRALVLVGGRCADVVKAAEDPPSASQILFSTFGLRDAHD